MGKKITCVVLGAGSRGQIYTNIMHEFPDMFSVVGVAEPIPEQMAYMKEKWNLADDMCFDYAEELLQKPKLADVCIVSTLDGMHCSQALAAIEKGYDILLEKPIAPTPEECVMVEQAALRKGVKILVCHVLRYTSFYRKIKEIVDSGEIGKIMNIQAAEDLGNVHYSHSYTRGNWRRSEETSNMLLAKCCHDIDILQWIINDKCTRASSFGSLTHFNSNNKPEGAPKYCLDGCPYGEECFYNAQKLYVDDKKNEWFRGVAAKRVHPSDEEVIEAVKHGQYGRCVYQCDNNVVDHQVVCLEFAGGATVDFSMSPFNYGDRYIRIMGTKGTIHGDMNDSSIEMYSFATREHTKLSTANMAIGTDITTGHGGGDTGIVYTLYQYLNDAPDLKGLTEIDISVQNHIITFAADEARVCGKVINLTEYREEIENRIANAK